MHTVRSRRDGIQQHDDARQQRGMDQCDGPGGWVAWQGLALLCIEGKEYVGMGMWSMWVGVLVWVLVWVFVWVWVWVWVSSMWCGCWCGC